MDHQRNRRRTAAEMQQVLEEWNRVRGRESQSAFCARHGVRIATFLYWRKRLRADSGISSGLEGTTPGFARIERPRVVGDCFVRIERGDGLRVEIMEAVSWSYLKGLLSW